MPPRATAGARSPPTGEAGIPDPDGEVPDPDGEVPDPDGVGPVRRIGMLDRSQGAGPTGGNRPAGCAYSTCAYSAQTRSPDANYSQDPTHSRAVAWNPGHRLVSTCVL